MGERELPARVRERLAAREASRRALARLPIEEKVRIIVRMQRAARAIALATGRPPPRVWDLPTD